MTSESVSDQKVLEIIKKHLPVAVQAKVALDTKLFKEELIDSLGVIQILTELEQEFGVSFEDNHLDASVLATPRQIHQLICELS
jgi:acyl carrier protein